MHIIQILLTVSSIMIVPRPTKWYIEVKSLAEKQNHLTQFSTVIINQQAENLQIIQ